MTVTRIDVNLGPRAYPIFVGDQILAKAGELITSLMDVTHAVVITDSNVGPFYLETCQKALENQGIRVNTVTVPAGETTKSLRYAEQLWNDLVDIRADRKTVIVALGGGVVGDLAGFIAATYARGLRLVQIPTSLLAQVDSSVGGKVGINLEKAKNMVGAFHQPSLVVIDVATLRSLPSREYISGLAEVVKYGVILDAQFFKFLEENANAILNLDPHTLTTIVARCCRLKADVVEADEREETGYRAILNYGHTFAHAFETLTGYTSLLHGEAVAIGMTCAARLATARNMFSREECERQTALLKTLGLPTEPPLLSTDDVLACMRRDKKVQHGQLRLILPKRLGQVELVGDVDPGEIAAVLAPFPTN
ncbi:MAG: 3-dehydroquinate synthase [Thermogutta sp.]|uniref:3-dehydroquinate synthase n=1 Tax=Thermogutta sp. TaxID=1962930 RepID=UPI0019CBFCEE|nr:3-dehydroquinate synthase [Thermogutta sp.]MBC7350964.1 3-dehydroquinate synthase [Thermogutta sp.]